MGMLGTGSNEFFRESLNQGQVEMPEEYKPDYKPPETMTLQYPKLADKITEKVQAGENRNTIRKKLALAETKALAKFDPQIVNEYLGRTDETRGKFWDAMEAQKDNAYVEIYKYDMSEGKVRDIVKTAKESGIDPGFLLANRDNKELMQRAEEAAGTRRGAFMQFVARGSNMLAGLLRGQAWKNTEQATQKEFMNVPEIKVPEWVSENLKKSGLPDAEKYADKAVEIVNKLIQPTGDPKEAAKNDLWFADWQQALSDKLDFGKVRPPDSVIGAAFLDALEQGGFTIKSAVTSAAGWILGGPIGGMVTSAYNTFDEAGTEAGGALQEIFQRKLGRQLKAGNAFMQALRESVKGGIVTKADIEKALVKTGIVKRNNLLLLPASNYAGDFILHGTTELMNHLAGELLPGGGILKSLGRGAIRFIVPTIGEGIIEGNEEYQQEKFQIEALDDDPNSYLSQKRLKEATKAGAVDSVIYSIFGLGAGAGFRQLRRFTPNARLESKINQVLDESVKEIADVSRKIEKGEINLDDVAGEDPIVFIPKSKITPEIAKALDIQEEEYVNEDDEVVKNSEELGVRSEELENNISEKNSENSESVSNEGENTNEENQEEQSGEENNDEIAVRKSTWDKFASENPEEAETLNGVIREGVQGVTVREQLARKFQEKIQAVAENSEVKKEKDRLKQEFIDAGRDENEAEILSTMAGIAAIRMSEQYPNVSIQQVMNITAKKVGGNDNLGVRESHNQATGRNGDGLINGLRLPFNPEDLRSESGQTIEEADGHEMVITPDGDENLGFIPEISEENIQAGNIQANVGVLRYIEKTHGRELRENGYSSAAELLLDVLNNFNFITPTRDNSLILSVKGIYDKNKLAKSVVQLQRNEDGTYRVKDAGIIRKDYLKNKMSLRVSRETLTTAPDNGQSFPFGYAQNQGSSEIYAEQSSNKNIIPSIFDSVNGEREIYNQTGFHGTQHIIEGNKLDLDKVNRTLYGWGVYLVDDKETAESYRNSDESDLGQIKKGNLYTFEGVPENDELLDFNAPMNEQPQKVQEAINSLIQYLEAETDFAEKMGFSPNDIIRQNIVGGRFYRTLSKYLKDGQKGASMLLNNFGIPGMRYLEIGSEHKENAHHNFVIWNTKLLKAIGISEDSENDAKEYFQNTIEAENKKAEVVEQRQPKGTREERLKFYEEFDKTHERPAYLDTGYVEAKITDHGSMIEIEFLGERANGISRRENLPSGRRADETERQRVIKYMLHDAIPELEMRVHDYFNGFPTIELYDKYKGQDIRNLSDEQKKEILDAAEKEIQRIMGAPLSQEGRELLEAQRYGSLPKGSEGLEVRSEEVKTTTEQETQETEEVENDTDGTLTDKKWGLPKGYRVEGAENPKSLKGAKKHQFVLRNGSRDWGYVTEDLAQGRADVPIGPIRVQAGNREYGLKHAITKHMNVILDNAVNIEAFIEDVIDNGNEIIPVGRDKQGRLSEFLVVWNDTKKNQNSVVIAWEEDGGYYTLKSAYPADSDYIKKQKSLSFGTTQTPNPASASIAYVNDKTLPGNNDATRYEDSDNNQSLTENVKNVNEDEKRLNQYREWVNVQPVELPKLKRNATQEEIKQAADEAITKLLDAFTITDSSGSKHILSEPFEKSLRTAQSPLLIEIAQKVNELIHEARHNEELYEANKKDIPTYKKNKLVWFITRELPYVHTGHSNGVTLRELKRGILLFQKELGEISDGVYKSAISFIDKNGADKFNDNVLADIVEDEKKSVINQESTQEQEQEAEPKFNLTPEQIEELFEDENQDSEDLIYGEKGEQVPQFTPTQQPEAQEQEAEQINASTSWEKGKPSNIAESLIEFFSTANKSSGFHEFAHHIMRVIGDVVEATEYGDNPDYLLINDFNMILENAGVSREEYENNEEKRNQAQEYFATAFETYLSEGHAPNKELVSAFERIKQWFVEVYRDIKETLGVELNDEMRDFFDRLLATPEQAAEQKSINDINSLYEATQEELEFTQDEIERLEAEQAEIEAQQELLEEMQGYEEPTIPQEVSDKVEKYLDKEYEGLDDELFQAKLRSAKSKSAKLQAFKEKDRREAENLYAPYIAINTDTLNAFLQQAGIDATRNYLKERAEYIQKLIKNLQKRLPGSYAQVLREQKKAEKTGQKGETLKQAQSEYNAIKSDIGALINEQKEISDSAEFLNRIDPNEIKESISFDNAMMTLAEAINNGLKLAERYAGIVYNEAQETQKAESERRAEAEIQSIESMNEYQINKLNSEHEAEIKKLKEQQAAEIAKLGEGSKEKISELKSKYEEKIAELKAAHAEKIKSLRENSRNKTAEKIASLKERYKQMKERQRERLKIRQEYNKLTGQIKRMAKSKNVIWNKQQKIKEVLGTYDNLIQKNYSLDDVREIHRQVEELYETGKRELEAKKLLIRERNAETRAKLTATLQEDYDKRPKKIIKGREDIGKDYSGIKGKARKILDWSTTNMLGAQRFFDWLDGNKKYQGVWNKFMSDKVNEAHNQELRHKFRRLGEFEAKRKELGINLSSLRNTRVIDINGGEDFTISELMGIYAGLKNEKAKQAILNGNFANAKDLNEANEWAAKCVEALTDKEKELADFIIQEYENNFDRINDAIIDVYNQGMEHEENYTPMRRLVFETHRNGIFDPDAAENAAKQGAGFRSVEKGFTENRKKINPKHQQGIDLDLISIWHSQVAVQEHAAAFAGLIRDMRSVLFARNKDGGATVYQMLKATRGQAAATKIRQYFNIAATSDALNAYDALEGISKVMARNMSIAYLCGNLGTMAKQTGSFPRVLVYAGPTATFNALGQFFRHPKKFIEECYKLDPQLEERQRDSFIDELIKGERGKIDVAYGNVLKAMSAPIGFSDRITSAIVFKAVYDANIKKGLSHDDAVREGQRVVLLTQPNTQAKDKPLVWQQHGYARLAMMFTTDMAQTFGETFYDLTASIRRGDVKDSVYRLVGLTLAACLIKCLTSGTPDEPDDPEELAKWIALAFTEQTINSIPVIGKNLVSLWDFKNGYFNSTDAFVAPFAKLAMGSRSLLDNKIKNDEQAYWNLIEGGALLAPFPATGLKRLWKAGKALGQDGAASALARLFGISQERKKKVRRFLR